ncbi:MAG TPA: PepSY-like domain-containing protein [Vicinamibacterales bacterium]|nr:PepSY-like domain-containing protein [Vicinamibacterales bacterium]
MRSILRFSAALALVSIPAAGVAAQEIPVAPDKIPAVVMAALHSRFPAAKIDKCVREQEGKQTVYDIEFEQNGRKGEADITAAGIYINFETAIPAASLPKPVRDAIEKRYRGATFVEVMEETEVKGKDEKVSAYEVVLKTAAGKQIEVRLSPDGKILES